MTGTREGEDKERPMKTLEYGGYTKRQALFKQQSRGCLLGREVPSLYLSYQAFFPLDDDFQLIQGYIRRPRNFGLHESWTFHTDYIYDSKSCSL